MSQHDIAAIALCIQVGLPPLVEGFPGGGKTACISSIARAIERPSIALIAALHEPSDFNGWPAVQDGVMRFFPAEWVRFCLDNPNAIVFFDELTTAPPTVQAALLRVLHERVVGSVKLPDTVSFVAACNPPDQAPGGWELSPPIANRVVHLAWEPALDDWIQGTLSEWPEPRVPVLREGWQAHVPLARSLVCGFLKSRPHLFRPPSLEQMNKAFTSPRMWTHAATLLGACLSLNMRYDDPVAGRLVQGCVGPGPAGEFLTYATEMDLPDPERLLADPGGYDYASLRGDQLYAVLASVAAVVLQNNTPQRWSAGWKVLFLAAKDHPDIACHTARTLARNRPAGEATIPLEARAFADILTQAGLMERRYAA